MAGKKSRFRFTLKGMLILTAAVATGLFVFELNREKILRDKLSGSFWVEFEVSRDYPISELQDRLNSQEILSEFTRLHPEHSRLMKHWDSGHHSIGVFVGRQGPDSDYLRVLVNHPVYCVRQRRFQWSWPFWRDQFVVGGGRGLEPQVDSLNARLYLEIIGHLELEVERGRPSDLRSHE